MQTSESKLESSRESIVGPILDISSIIVGVIGGSYILLLEYGILPRRLASKAYRPTPLMKALGFIILAIVIRKLVQMCL